jgi:cobalt-zinc-cadmium efflux system membrane fusion protein
MKTKFCHRPTLTALVLCCVLALTACKKATVQEASKPESDVMRVFAPESLRSQIQVSEVQSQDLSDMLRVAGQIDFDEQALTRIGASVTGRVTHIQASLGQVVNKGDTLALINSSELSGSQLAYLKARSEKELHRRTVARAKTLFEADVISAAELQRRESELAVARAELRAAGDQLRLMGLPSGAIERLRDQGTLHPVAAVSATLAGVVIERKVSHGQVAQPGDPLFTVADLSTVWVVGALPEQTARSVQAGQTVNIEVPALDNRSLSGKIVFVGDTVSPETRSVTIRTQVDNFKRDLKPQMLATMRVRGSTQQVLALPAQAVVRENDRDHVFVRTAELRYRLTPVELGPAQDELRPVLKGLPQGSEVVTEGAFHMNNERKRAELE